WTPIRAVRDNSCNSCQPDHRIITRNLRTFFFASVIQPLAPGEMVPPLAGWCQSARGLAQSTTTADTARWSSLPNSMQTACKQHANSIATVFARCLDGVYTVFGREVGGVWSTATRDSGYA